MSMIISREGPRGCGYRKVGGIYLVCDGPGHVCEMLPLEMHSCPTCGQGIKPARGWTWINPAEMFRHERCDKCEGDIPVVSVPAGTKPEDLPVTPYRSGYCRFTQVMRAGLVWVGEQFYPTPAHFNKEANGMGISRRITRVPRGFVIGETWVLLAHRKVNFHAKDQARLEKVDMSSITMIDELEDERPGVFTAFLPSRIEKIVDESATPTDIRQIEEDGMTAVRVVRLGENCDLFEEEDDTDDTGD